MKRFLIRTGQTAAQLTNGRQGWIGTSGREPPFYFNNESLVLAVYRLSMTESGKITKAEECSPRGTLQRQGGAPLHEAATHSNFHAREDVRTSRLP